MCQGNTEVYNLALNVIFFRCLHDIFYFYNRMYPISVHNGCIHEDIELSGYNVPAGIFLLNSELDIVALIPECSIIKACSISILLYITLFSKNLQLVILVSTDE